MTHDWFEKLASRHSESLKGISNDDFLALVRPKCKHIVTQSELATLVASKKKLRIKFGIDPTSADVHLGHAVPIMLLNLFQRRGHEIHFLIGDFTGKIGDPAGRNDERVVLTDKTIRSNMKTYTKQVRTLLNIEKAKVHQNSTWLRELPLVEFFEIIGAVSFGEIAQREDFRERIKSGRRVSLREANYAALMGIDSLHLKADIEVGGIDQLLNFMQGREIMSASGTHPEVVLATPLIEGTSGDGRKMSKSFNNYIPLSTSADEMFGLVMRIPDVLMKSYFVSFADVSELEQNELENWITENPNEAKKQLASFIAFLFHGKKRAQMARDDFERKFSKKEYSKSDEQSVSISLPMGVVDALFEAFRGSQSKTHIRKLIEQKGVKRLTQAGEEPITDPHEEISSDDVIKVGKLHLFRFRAK